MALSSPGAGSPSSLLSLATPIFPASFSISNALTSLAFSRFYVKSRSLSACWQDALGNVDTDLDFELSFLEFAMLDEHFPNIE